tara:strand:- start:1297 stop:2808 length:1512 start_codon:yes stop_codon:yes gene_type:complete
MARYSGTNNIGRGLMQQHDASKTAGGIAKYTGVFICKVIDIVDDRYEGYMYVEIVGEGYIGQTDSKENRHKYHRVRRGSPYGGSYQYANATNSYGFSSHPPAPGSQVLVAFPANSDTGIMISVLPDVTRNASVPTNPSGFVDSSQDEIGPSLDTSVFEETDKNKRPRASSETVRNSEDNSDKQKDGEAIGRHGLGLDSIRGLGSSSQRRESPTNVFGFNTPGGHSLVLDDGTLPNSETCLTPDKERKGGLSNLVRLASAGGAQVLMHDGAGIIYVISQTGKTWIQLSADGKIDLYAEDDISMHTATDFNLYCTGDFNLDANSINIRAREGDTNIEMSKGEFNLHANKDIKLTSDLNGHIKCAGNTQVTAAMIDLNGPEATAANKPKVNNLTTNESIKQSIGGRVPEAEPWGGHAEEQEMLPQVASSDTQFTAKDIDMKAISNRQQPNVNKNNVKRKSGDNPRTPTEEVEKFNENPNFLSAGPEAQRRDGRNLPPQYNSRSGAG